jgi:hypothetical protein
MEIDESVFSKLPPKILILIVKLIIEGGFNIKNPYNEFDKNFLMLEKIASNFGIPYIFNYDVEFMSKFITDNKETIDEIFKIKNKSVLEKLIYPKNKKFKVNYVVFETKYVKQSYNTEWLSYDEKFVISSIKEARNDGNFDDYQGNLYNEELIDSDFNDITFNDFTEITSNKNESILDRLVIENTSSVIDSLDRDTLINLRNIINSRLNSF